MNFFDRSRDRSVDVDLYVNRLSEAPAARGYLVASVHHELALDALLTETGPPYVGRISMHDRGTKNIKFAIAKPETLEPEADFAT